MSLPQFQKNDPPLSRDDVINQIISSIAMEELGLSHIINAEGEKLQYALGTIDGVTGPEGPLTMDELLKLNDSVHKTLGSAALNQFLLKDKLQNALSASILQGPTGPTGPTGPGGGPMGPTGPTGPTGENGTNGVTPGIRAGTTTTIDYTEDAKVEKSAASTETDIIFDFLIPQGEPGTSIRLLNTYDDLSKFEVEHPTGNPGDSYMVGGYLLTWDEASGSWLNLGYFRGSEGPTGATGLNAYEFAKEQGFPGTEDEWLESLRGETGAIGETGPRGETGPTGATGLNAYEFAKEQGFTGDEDEWLESLRGETGPIGETGPTGKPGPGSAIGTIIPFASGAVVSLVTRLFIEAGTRSQVAFVGFGASDTIDSISDPINTRLTNQYAFSMPVDGTITAFTAYFTTTANGLLGVRTEITARLYYSKEPNDTFLPFTESDIILEYTGSGTNPNYLSNTKPLSIPVTANTRILLVFFTNTPDHRGSTTTTGYAGGGVQIQ